MLIPVHCRKCQQWTREHRNCTTEQWKKVGKWWPGVMSLVFFYTWMAGCMSVAYLRNMGRRQASRGSLMLCTMFCLETLSPAIHVYRLPKHYCRHWTSLHGHKAKKVQEWFEASKFKLHIMFSHNKCRHIMLFHIQEIATNIMLFAALPLIYPTAMDWKDFNDASSNLSRFA